MFSTRLLLRFKHVHFKSIGDNRKKCFFSSYYKNYILNNDFILTSSLTDKYFQLWYIHIYIYIDVLLYIFVQTWPNTCIILFMYDWKIKTNNFYFYIICQIFFGCGWIVNVGYGSVPINCWKKLKFILIVFLFLFLHFKFLLYLFNW